MTTHMELVAEYLAGVAQRNEPAPTNIAIAQALGIDPHAATYAVMKLKRQNIVTIDKRDSGGARRFRVVATGAVTAWSLSNRGGVNNPSGRNTHSGPRNYVRRLQDEPNVDALLLPAPRTTCWRCGARSDAGCGHILPEWQSGVAA